jgi:glycosyltransferase involved in cell wall biosynthesis
MNILFVHKAFPTQFLHLARHYAADPTNNVVAITDAGNNEREFIRTIRYDVPRLNTAGLDRAKPFIEHVAHGEGVAAAAIKLKNEGFAPDLIVGHSGWGETLFLKDIWPRARQAVYFEFFYRGDDCHTNFDPEFQKYNVQGISTNNASLLLALTAADRGWSPTHWQRSMYPVELQNKIEVVHEGIDTDVTVPDPSAQVSLDRDGPVLRPGDEVVTFCNRNLEPYRGYHILMRALPRILKERPKARALIIGGDGLSYGLRAPGGKSWRDVFLDEVKDRLDMSRVHFVGWIPHSSFIKAMQVSSVHVYFTFPFFLSWSMVEAMACGGLVIGSDTSPVREVVRHGANGLLSNFFNSEALAEKVIDALASPERYRSMREAARRTVVDNYDLKRVCLPRQLWMLDRLMAR